MAGVIEKVKKITTASPGIRAFRIYILIASGYIMGKSPLR